MSRYNESYDKLKWRVDLCAASKLSSDINEPIAHFQLKTNPSNKIVNFDMNQLQLTELITTFDEIQKKFEDFA